MRCTHLLRLALREVGRRQVDVGVFDEVGDVFYLIPDEIAAPELVADRIPDRRAERTRLSALHLPPMFTLHWEPLNARTSEARARVLHGIGASPGVVRGPVRIVKSSDEVEDIEPGNVLVVHVTDVGWTPIFGCVAAVVTDVGDCIRALPSWRASSAYRVSSEPQATLDLANGRHRRGGWRSGDGHP